MTTADFLWAVFNATISLFTIMNPFGSGAVMLSLMDEDSGISEVHDVAKRSSKTIFVAMLIAFLVGTYVFEFFGISAHSLRAFGGVILFFMGWNMVQGHTKRVNASEKERTAAREQEDISVVPLAIPIIVGPGLITTLITYSSEVESNWSYGAVVVAIILATLLCYLILRNMISIKSRLGTNGLRVFTRVMGLVVGSIGAQMIIQGIKALIA